MVNIRELTKESSPKISKTWLICLTQKGQDKTVVATTTLLEMNKHPRLRVKT